MFDGRKEILFIPTKYFKSLDDISQFGICDTLGLFSLRGGFQCLENQFVNVCFYHSCIVSQGFTQPFQKRFQNIELEAEKRGEKGCVHQLCLWWCGLSIMSCRDARPLCNWQKESPPQNMDMQMPLFDLETTITRVGVVSSREFNGGPFN